MILELGTAQDCDTKIMKKLTAHDDYINSLKVP